MKRAISVSFYFTLVVLHVCFVHAQSPAYIHVVN